MNHADHELARMTAQPATIAEARQAADAAWVRCLAAKPGSRASIAAHRDHNAAWVNLRALRAAVDA